MEKPVGVQLQRPAAEGIAKTGFGAKVEGAYARSNNTGGVETKFKFLEREPWPGPVGYRRRPGPAFSLNKQKILVGKYHSTTND